MLVFWLLAPNMVGAFTPISEVQDAGVRVFRISLLSFIILGPQMIASTGIQALGKAKESLILSVARQGLFYVPLMFIMRHFGGFNGLILAQPVADACTLVLGIIFLVLIFKKVMKEAGA